jgi:hypothetical protein
VDSRHPVRGRHHRQRQQGDGGEAPTAHVEGNIVLNSDQARELAAALLEAAVER